jgi:hypothetical protein
MVFFEFCQKKFFFESIVITLFEPNEVLRSVARKTFFVMFEQVLKSMCRGNFTKSASQKRDPAKGCSFVPAVSENVAFGVRKEMAGHETIAIIVIT